jgi:hypothetical protein
VSIEFAPRPKWRSVLVPKVEPDVAVEIEPVAADAGWVLETPSGAVADAVDDLLLLCEYTVQ